MMMMMMMMIVRVLVDLLFRRTYLHLIVAVVCFLFWVKMRIHPLSSSRRYCLSLPIMLSYVSSFD